MLGKVFVGQDAQELDVGQEPAPITGVTLKGTRVKDSDSGETISEYSSGNGTGRVIEKDCPWATQAMAESVLLALKDVKYIPFDAQDAILDPAAEIGDGITIDSVYSILAESSITFDKMCLADVSAPSSDDLDDEYPYLSAEKRVLDKLEGTIDELEESIGDLEGDVEDLYEKIEDISTTMAAKEVLNISVAETQFTVTFVDETVSVYDYTVDTDGRMTSITKVVE